jgi:hypothetical protein
MTRLLAHVRRQFVAYLALFVALGGTGYAAFRLPAGSVGNRQLKNHSVSPIKLDRSSIAGYVRDWAKLDGQGHVIASRPRVTVIRWNPGPDGVVGGVVQWPKRPPKDCFALGNAENLVTPAISVNTAFSSGGSTQVGIAMSASAFVDVAVVCPQP